MDFFTTLVQGVKDIFQSLLDLPGKIVGLLGDLLKALFIPGDDYFSKHIASLQTSLANKLDLTSYNDLINTIQNAVAGDMPNITFMGVTFIDFNLFKQYKPQINSMVRGFLFLFLIYYNIRNVYKLMRKDELASGGSGTTAGSYHDWE